MLTRRRSVGRVANLGDTVKDQFDTAELSGNAPIAIVGMACRLPGGNRTPDQYWEFLKSKGQGITEVPADRWGAECFYDEDPDAISKSVSKWAGFVDDLDQFDAQFFGISPREAAAMDPQQRLLLQGTYEAMQDSRIPMKNFSAERTGVYVGISQSDYRTVQELRLTSNENFAGTGYALCINANRISHRFNLTGPSSSIDTACSSSMVALDQGVQGILSGSCDMAVVGGVNVLAHPSSFIAFSKAGMLSKTGKISTFDKNANGFVRGEGCGVVILKPYARAVEDGDQIHALIHATACNQDGFTSTITAPNQNAQIDMLEKLFEKSGLPKDWIGFVEAHGTGTPVGDPIEAGAIGRVIGQNVPDRPVFVGSGKANVGHGESVAGITGLIKATLAVKNGTVPPNVNFSQANPFIPMDALNLQVPVKPEPFPAVNGRHYAVVNSFGYGGTNASAIISSPPPMAKQPVEIAPKQKLSPQFPLFFPISATSQDGLAANAEALLGALKSAKALKNVDLPDVAHALASTRNHFNYRAVVMAHDRRNLTAALRVLAAGDADAIAQDARIVTGQAQTNPKLAFTFSGQGSQWWAMARHFLEHEPVFADAVDAYDAHFVAASGWSIKEELLRDESNSRINDTTVTQPALFAIQSGLAALWAHIGVKPDMVLGHSIGEAAASYVAGGISLSGAARFLNKRGAIRDQLGAKGAMAAVGMNHLDVAALIADEDLINIAAVNGPGSTTISGDYDAIHDFVEDFEIHHPDTFIRLLQVDTAWHSYQLEAGESWFRTEMAQIDWSVPTLPFISTVTGKLESRFDSDYGWLNLRRPVMFQQGVEAALAMGANTFVELGPHSTLAGPTTSTALEAGAKINVYGSLSRKHNDFDHFSRIVASVFVDGIDLDWAAVNGRENTAKVDLPQLPWAEEAYWSDSEESRQILTVPVKHPYLGMRATDMSHSWKSEINLKAYPYLKDHRLQSETIFPAAGYIDTLLACANEMWGDKPIEIEQALIHDAMFIGADQEILLSSVYAPERGKLRLYSRVRDAGDEWVLRSEAFVRVTDVPAPRDIKFDPETTKARVMDESLVYDVDGKENFINYGENFQVVRDLWMTNKKTVARIVLPADVKSSAHRHFAHPTMLDGCLQITDPRMTPAKLTKGRQPGDPTYLPVGAERIRFYGRLPDEIFVHSNQIRDPEAADARGGFTITDRAGKVLMTMDGLMMKSLPTDNAPEADGEVAAHFATETISELRDASDVTPAETPGHWVVLGDDVDGLVKNLSKQADKITVLSNADLGDDIVDGLNDHLEAEIEKGSITGILVAWPLAIDAFDGTSDAEELLEPVETCVTKLVALGDFMDFHRMAVNGLPKITVLTKGAYGDLVGGSADPVALRQRPILAVSRALATETPEYTLRAIDVDDAALNSADLAARILGDTSEFEVALQGGRLFAPRLNTVDENDMDPKLLRVTDADTVNFHATMRTPGVIDDLELAEIPLEPMGPDDVRVRIAAVGLNFRDVMAVTGLLPSEAEADPAWQHLGLEFGATVHEVGANVTGFKPGDRVMGLGRRCLQRFMTVDPRSLTILPEHISLEQAATIPSAFATAHYALNRVGRMAKGEKVFIHVATGGVGTAAVQLAKQAGAEIFATAGSPAKRKLLREWGVPHIMDSRSLKFADDVERITEGRGVDLLLNSLPGDYIAKGLDIIAPYGRFIEIGKRDVYADSSVGMKALRKNVSMSVLDLAAMGNERPELLADIFAELVTKFEDRSLEPLPVTQFAIADISDAFRYMSQARHVGKVVVTLEDEEFAVRRDADRPVTLRDDASYLITGGTRGFCLTIADWFSRSGAGTLHLVSRSGEIQPADAKKIAKIESRGTKVIASRLDVTDADAVTKFVTREVAHKKHPLRGVVHGAAVIKDGFANQLTPEMIRDVLRPKIIGGWALHQAFEKAGVSADFMIGFSSIAQVIGSGGQCNYVAGNAFLDALADYRGGLGQSGCAIDWGAMADSGFVARSDGLASYLESVGLHGLTDAETDTAMEASFRRETHGFVYSKADWPQIARANAAHGNSPRFAPLLQTGGGGNSEIRARLMSLTGDELVAEAADFIMDEICGVLKIDKSTIQPDRPMSELGLDSLSSFELKMRVETALDFSLPVSKFLQAPSVDELSQILAEEVGAMVAAEELGAQEGGDAGTDAEGPAVKTAQHCASNAQIGLIRAAIAPMSSVEFGQSLIHSVALPAGDATDAEIVKALKKLNRRHPALRLQFADGPAQGAANFTGQGIVFDAKVDVSAQIYAAANRAETTAETTVVLNVHAGVADAGSVEILARELQMLIAGDSLPKAPSKAAYHKLFDGLHYDPDVANGQNDRAFWWYHTVRGAAPLPFAARGRAMVPAALGRNHGHADCVAGPMLGDLGERQLMMRFAQALRAVTKTSGAVMMSRLHCLRRDPDMVGALSHAEPFVVGDDPQDAGDIARLDRCLSKAAEHRAFDSFAAVQELSTYLDDWGVSPFQIGFAPKVAAFSTKGAAHFDVLLERRADGACQIVFDRDVLSAETARALVETLEHSVGKLTEAAG